MAEEFIIRLIPDGGTGGVSGGATGGASTSSALGGIGKAFKGAMKAIGIGSIIGLILKIVSSFQSLLDVVASLVKIVTLIFKPLADALTILLLPLIFLLKPIVMALNDIMRPFFKLSMEVMKKGAQSFSAGNTKAGFEAFGGASSIIIAGLANVLVALTSQLVKMIFALSGELLKLIFPVFSGAIDNFIGNINTMVDDTAVVISAAIGGYAAGIGKVFGADIDSFKEDHKKAIHNLFTGSEGIGETYDAVFDTTRNLVADNINGLMIQDPDSFLNTIEATNAKLSAAAQKAGNDLVDAFEGGVESSIASIRRKSKNKSGGKFDGKGVTGSFDGKTSSAVSSQRQSNSFGINSKAGLSAGARGSAEAIKRLFGIGA